MKRIALTCKGNVDIHGETMRYAIDIDEGTGDANIVRCGAALIDRDTSAWLPVFVGDESGRGGVRIAVEVSL